ncbi:hypothetical protein [Methylibium sp.]|uniref:hypothetical protein n=1 Tax=Methylibium sp. TaxID=2067992 RepID=UPI00286BBE7A|nr:hypothetical protein [Methylibium sp.]
MNHPQHFKLASSPASSGARDSGHGALGPAGLRAQVLPTRHASGQLELPLVMTAVGARQRLRTG